MLRARKGCVPEKYFYLAGVERCSPHRSPGAAPAISDGAGRRAYCNFNFQSTRAVTVDGCATPQIHGCGQLVRAIMSLYDELLMSTRVA